MISNKKILFLLFLTLPILIFSSSLFPVYEVSEAREGVVVKSILNSGNWILPLRQEEIIPSKPILFHWLSALLAKVFASYNDILLRLPSVLAAFVLILGNYFITKKILNKEIALVASLALFSTHSFFQLAIDGRVDMLFSLFVDLALLLWIDAAIITYHLRLPFSKIKESRYFFISVLCGLAVLTKGPLGIALPGMIISVIAFLYWGFWGFLNVFRPSWVFSLLIPGIWYYLAWQNAGDAFIGKHLFFENINRFSGAKGITGKPWWFYLNHFWTQTFPWCLLVFVPGVLGKFSQRFSNPYVKALLVWILLPIFVFSLSSGKRSAYLLPILPAVIGLITYFVFEYFKEIKNKKFEIFSFLPLLLFLFSIFCIKLIPLSIFNLETQNTIQAILFCFSDLGARIIFALVLLGIINFYLFYNSKRSAVGFFIAIIFFNIQLVSTIIPFYVSAKARTHGMQTLVDLAKRVVPKTEKLKAIKTYQDESLDVFFYYYPGSTGIILPNKLNTLVPGYYIAVSKYKKAFYEKASTLGLAISELGFAKRLSDEQDQTFFLFKLN